jgi:hypothetical protein
MNVAVKMNEENEGGIFHSEALKFPLSPAFPDETDAPAPFIQADISAMCVSNWGLKREVIVPARIVAEAVRLILDSELPPPREPGRAGSDEPWFDDVLDIDCMSGLIARTPQDRSERTALPFGFRYDPDAPGPVIRSAINRDKNYRSRATLREVCRNDPSAFADAIPHDIADRVTIPNAFDEAHAILQAVSDRRPARAWLRADPDEQVTLIDYAPPTRRTRSRSIPGVVVTREDGAIVLTLRERDLDPPKSRRVH